MTQRTYTNRKYLDALNERVLIFDGAMGTSLQLQNLTAEHFGGEKYVGCNDYLVLTYPEAVEKVHRSFFEVGVDVVETDTFRSNRLTLDEYGLGDKTYEINFAAAQLARKIADEYSAPILNPSPEGGRTSISPPSGERPREGARFVAGSIGPTGKLPSADDPDLSDVSYDELSELFREQATGLLQGGVDVLLIETSQDILEVKAAIEGIQTAFAETKIVVPLQAQITLDTTGRMLFGTDIAAAVSILEGLPIDVIGMNCSTGPEHMRAPIEFLGENTTLPVSCIPNAGMPMNVDGEAVYHLEPENFANDLYEFVEKNNISVVGGCCGTTPAHLSALVEKMRGTAHPHRPDRSTPRLASGIRSFTMRQEPAPLIIGERCNAQGSRKFKRLLLEENWDEILEVARQQVDYGSHALDISVAVTENDDESQLMHDVVRKLVTAGIDVPLVFDTTDIAVMEAGLKVAPGRSMLNSTHLESGREKADKVFALAKKHNATVMVLTIDEVGMAKTAERKLEIAKRIHDIAVNDHGLKSEDLIFDALTFTLATGEAEYIDSAKDTIEGIKLIKAELPGVFTSLGVSNVSFGLSKGARPIINSTFLYHCVQAGLDMAIINPAHTPPFGEIPADEREMAEDLIFNKRPDALQRIIEHFEGREATALDTSIDPTEGMTLAERLHWRIVLRQPGAVGESASVENDVVEIVEGAFLPSPLGRRVGDEGDSPYKLPMSEAFKARVRELRKEQTDPEKLMWTLLRNRALDGAKFRRQHPHKGYILDFYCHAAKLAIELDGSGHLEEEQIRHDEERTKILEEDGIKVLRFWNNDVSNDTETVLGEIWEALDARGGFPHPSPLPKGEGTLASPDGASVGDERMFDNLHDSAIYQLNNVLLPAMKEVGDKFGAGELILPFVLQSAEVMKKAVARLEEYLERAEGTSKGKVVLATVYGDVHDIGKNLVKTILTNNGFEVVDLGKQVPAETIIKAAIEEKADAIGLSALLVSTSKQMPLIVNELHRRGQNIPIMLGGAAINRRFGLRINKTEDGGQYGAGAFYCKDAFEGLETMEELQDDKRKPALVERLQAQVTREIERASQEKSKKKSSIQRSKVVPNPIPLPFKLGAKIVKDMPLEMVFEHLYKKELFRLSWGAKNAHGAEWEKLEAEFETRLAKMKKEAVQTGWLKPQGVYGFFPCQADGDELVIYNPTPSLGLSPFGGEKAVGSTTEVLPPSGEGFRKGEELTRFAFPRQPTGDNLCLADYFAPLGSEQMDVVAFQVVTVGQEATKKFDALQDAGDYSEGYYVHGLAVQTAEAAANYLHAHIQREMGIPAKQGKRYSWGYPAIPDLDDHKKVFELLPVEEALGMTLSAAYQLIPEQSTAAIILHHPDASYYTVGESRTEQLSK